MNVETLSPDRGTCLRINDASPLIMKISPPKHENLLVINGNSFYQKNLSGFQLKIASNDPYMVINKNDEQITLHYSKDVSLQRILYDPYKYEKELKVLIEAEQFKRNHEVPDGYIDILAKWYSIKFTYPTYNLIYIKPEMGISFQKHEQREEYWEVMGGEPIILSGNQVEYFVKKGARFCNPKGGFHGIINPDKKYYAIIKESWGGNFDEADIERVFNPNHYG